MDLADTVNRAGSLHRDIRGGIPRRIGTECADRRRYEDPQLVLLRQLDDVVHSYLFCE